MRAWIVVGFRRLIRSMSPMGPAVRDILHQYGPAEDIGFDMSSDRELRAAVNHQRVGRVREALRLYEVILANEPEHPHALNFAGVAHAQMGNGRRAIELLRKAIDVQPGNPQAHRNLGITLRDEGRLDEAAHALRRVIDILPESAEGYNELGIVLRRAGKLEQAATAYRRALALEPKSAQAHANLGNALQEQDKLDEACVSYRQALAIDPGMATVHRGLGNALQRLERFDEAIDRYRRSLEADPGYARAYSDLGSALVERGELDDGIDCLRRAIECNPGAAYAHSNLGMALHRLGDLHAAREAYDASLALEPGNTHALAFKFITLHELGDTVGKHRLVDIHRFLRRTSISTPDGYASVDDFNADLSDYAEHRDRLKGESTSREGITGELFAEAKGPVIGLKAIIRREVEHYIASLPNDPAHPFVARQPQQFRLIGWANLLQDNANIHIHPGAWLSGAYYARTRELEGGVDEMPAGGIGFGPPDPRFTTVDDFECHTVEAHEGRLLLFPSYFWHGILPFKCRQRRISYAFDILIVH